MSSLLILGGETFPTPREDPRDVVKRAAATWAKGAKNEVESKVLTALRRGGTFVSASTIAAFVKCDEQAVRTAVNDLVARQLLRWGNDQIGTGGYRAHEKCEGFNIS